MKYYVDFVKDGNKPFIRVRVDGDGALGVPSTEISLTPDATEEEIKDAGYKLLAERKAAILEAQKDVSSEVVRKLKALEAKISKENDVTDRELEKWQAIKTKAKISK